MFNRQDIKNGVNIKPTDQAIKNWEQVALRQEQDEVNLLAQIDSCEPLNVDGKEIVKHIDNMNSDILKQYLNKQFFNTDVIETTSCIVQSLTSISKDWKEYIDRHFTNLKQIGAPSVNGIAMVSDLSAGEKKSSSLFIIKVSRKVDETEILQHEAVIGMCFLNKLREYIPNFACVYGFFSCGLPALNSKGEVKKWCGETDNNSTYVVYENITNAQSMGDLIKKDRKKHNQLNPEIYLKYFIQFLFALRTANKFCKFTHYDCHADNTLLKKLDKPAVIKFPLEFDNIDNCVYIETDTILTFIDYGHCYVEDKDGANFGTRENFIQYNLFNDRPFLLADVYKYLTHCFIIMRSSLRSELKPLLDYFIFVEDKNLFGFINNQAKNFYNPPYTQSTMNFDIDDYISYCINFANKNNYNTGIVNHKTTDINLFCSTNNCSNYSTILQTLDLNFKNKITSNTDIKIFMEVYDVLSESEKVDYLNDFLSGGEDSKYSICVSKTFFTMDVYKKLLDAPIIMPQITNTIDEQSVNEDNDFINIIIRWQKIVSLYNLLIKLNQIPILKNNDLKIKLDQIIIFINKKSYEISTELSKLHAIMDHAVLKPDQNRIAIDRITKIFSYV